MQEQQLETLTEENSEEVVAEELAQEAATVAEDVAEQKKNPIIEFFKLTVDDLKSIVMAIIVAILLVTFVAQPVIVQGDSMNDTLYSGERLLIEKVSRYYNGLERYDIIVLDAENEAEELFIKRIIGLPGEMVRIDKDGNIYINDKLLEDDVYGIETIKNPGRAGKTIELGPDEYFVMGDNRNDSLDSRFHEVGNVNKDQIIGRVLIEMFPFQKVE